MAEIPLLQIVHVSDLHICENYRDRDALKNRAMRLWVRTQLENRNLFGWHEGTLPHEERAMTAFERFLRSWPARSPGWFPDDRTKGPATWLVDTGDATTFGDQASLERAHDRLRAWREMLGSCEYLSVFGNHDAWPGTQPVLLAGAGYSKRSSEQRTLLGQWPAWDTGSWLKPLVTPQVQGVPRIECYGLNSISFALRDNVRAIGRVSAGDLNALCTTIDARDKVPTYRVLAMHHPLSFPYESDDATQFGVLDTMVLSNAKRVSGRLKNDPPAEGTRERPYVHMLLSGHTHLGHPGCTLPADLKESRQGRIARDQVQLVSGSLMLVRDDDAVRAGRGAQVHVKARDDFTHPKVFDATQQFQILRFSFDTDTPGGLLLERRVMARLDNSPLGYGPVPEMTSKTFVAHSG